MITYLIWWKITKLCTWFSLRSDFLSKQKPFKNQNKYRDRGVRKLSLKRVCLGGGSK